MPPKISVEYPDYLTLRLDSGMRKKLEEMAKAEERSIGSMARIILREGLETREGKKAGKGGTKKKST